MTKCKILLSLAAIVICGFAYGQKYTDLISVSEQFSPRNNTGSKSAESNIHEINFAAKAPIKVNATDYALFGIGVNRLLFQGDSLPGGSSFTAFTVQLGYIANFGRYNLTAVALPKISSDFAQITHRSFQMGGLVLLSVKHTENFKLKYGLYYNQEFFGPLIVPIVGLDWKVSERMRIFGNLPINATGEYTVSKRFSTGIYFNANTASYLYDKQKTYIHKSTLELSAFGDLYLTKTLVFQTKLGYTFGREFNLFGLSDKIDAKCLVPFGDDRLRLNPNLWKDGVIAEMKLIFRVPTQ